MLEFIAIATAIAAVFVAVAVTLIVVAFCLRKASWHWRNTLGYRRAEKNLRNSGTDYRTAPMERTGTHAGTSIRAGTHAGTSIRAGEAWRTRARSTARTGAFLGIPFDGRLEPLRGYKQAKIVVVGKRAYFEPSVMSRAITQYGVEEESRCAYDHTHDRIPARHCWCGFYAYKSKYSVASYYNRLSVDLFGRVIEHSEGYRAEYQRVLLVEIPSHCAMCGSKATRIGTSSAHRVYPLCSRCHFSIPTSATAMSLMDLAGLLGTEVKWRET